MNLLIDVGYTAIKAAWADGITLGKTFRYQGERTADFILGLVEKNRPDVMVLSSVREFSQTAISKFGKCCGKFILIDSEHNFILEDNALPAYLTPDRAASVIAAPLSGKAMTPGGGVELCAVLGKDESVKRVKAAIEKLTK